MSRRILLLTEIIAPYRIPVFNALAEREDVDLNVVFLADNHPTLRKWLIYKDEIRFSYKVLPFWRGRIFGHHVLLNRRLWPALSGWNPDVIICGGYNYLASWQANLWAKAHRVPFVLWCESNLNDRRSGGQLVDFLKKVFIRGCSGFVVPGSASFAYLRSFGVPEEMVVIAPNAVDNSLFSRLANIARLKEAAVRRKLGLPPRFFLFVGRLVEQKGVFGLLEAYSRLEEQLRSEVGLVFVGDGPAKPRLIDRAGTITPGSVHCVGFVHRDDLPAYYALAEALVFPTLSDPWGLVVNEAMACGLPVIGSHVAGCTPDLVEDRWNGYVVSPGDRQKMASAMTALARRPELAKQMGARSFERILRYSPEACATGLATAAGANDSSGSCVSAE